MHWILIAVIGAGVGFLSGLFGKGGSAVATPLLAAIGVPPLKAVASPLPATIPGTLLAYRRYHDAGYRERRIVLLSLKWAVPATIAGAIVTHWLSGNFLVKLTDLLVAGLGARVATGAHFGPSRVGAGVATGTHLGPSRVGARAATGTHLGPSQTGAAAAAGSPVSAITRERVVLVAVVAGFVAGLLANSGGFLLAPLYLLVLRLPMKDALATSLAVASALALPGTIVHAALGHIDWSVTLTFALASVPLAGMGAKVALRTDPARLEKIYGVGLLALGLVLLAL